MGTTRGFTLLELLVAIAIFSVLGLGAYQMLQTVVAGNDRVRATSEAAIDLGLTLSILQRDFSQFVPRPVRDQYGEPVPPLMFDHEGYVVEFTRGGWSNPAGHRRSRLQRVAYRIDYDEGTLTRDYWKVLDRAGDSEPVSQLLLNGITDFRVTGVADDSVAYPESGHELDQERRVATVGVAVAVAIQGVGEIERLFQLADAFNPDDPGNRPGGGEGSNGTEGETDQPEFPGQ